MGEEETTLRLCSGGDPLMELTEKQTESGTALTSDLLPRRTLTSSGSALDRLFGAEEQPAAFDFFRAVEELEGCYQALTDAIIPYAEEKKANYKIKDIGSSRWSRVARLTAEQSAEIAPQIAAVLGCGMDDAFRAQLEGITFSKGFVVALYQSEQDGRDMAVYMKGYATPADGKPRALAFQWAFAEKDGVRTDTLKYELVKSKTKIDYSREVHASLKRRADSELLLDGKVELIVKEIGSTVTTTHEYDLSGREKKGVRPVQGSFVETIKTKVGEKTETVTTTVTPDLRLTSAEGVGVLSGTAAIEQKTGKQVHTALTLLFDEESARLLAEAAQSGKLYAVGDAPAMSSLSQNVEITLSDVEADKPESYLVGEPPVGMRDYPAPEEETTVDLDSVSPDDLTAEMAQRLAGRLLAALSKLPEEDNLLIRQNMSEEDWQTFMALVDEL